MPNEKKYFDANLARQIAEDYIKEHKESYYKRIEIVGSLRREKAQVHDIDMVAIPIYPQDKKIIQTLESGIKIDIYLADEKSYECIKLIRTGSAEHNRKLCIIAKSRGWQLKANGEGLITPQATLTGEREILMILLGKYIEPKDRM